MAQGPRSADQEVPRAGLQAVSGAGCAGHVRQVIQLDRCDEALALYRLRLAAGLATLEDHRFASEALFSLGCYTDALAACERAAALDPDDSLIYENRGTILAMLGRDEEALASYGRACECAPSIQPLMWLNYATTLRVMGRFEAALLLYKKGLALHPHPAQAIVLLTCKGDTLMDLGSIREAVHAYEEAEYLAGGLAPDAPDRPGADFCAHLEEVKRTAQALF